MTFFHFLGEDQVDGINLRVRAMVFNATFNNISVISLLTLLSRWIKYSKQRREVWSHATALMPPLFIEVPVPRQESERSCICVLGGSILSLFLRFLEWISELFWQCTILICFSFHYCLLYRTYMYKWHDTVCIITLPAFLFHSINKLYFVLYPITIRNSHKKMWRMMLQVNYKLLFP